MKNMDRNMNFGSNLRIHKAHTILGTKQKAVKNRGRTIAYLSKGAGKLEFPAVL